MAEVSRESGRALDGCGPVTGNASVIAGASRQDAFSRLGVRRATVGAGVTGTVLAMAVPGRSEDTVSRCIVDITTASSIALEVQRKGG